MAWSSPLRRTRLMPTAAQTRSLSMHLDGFTVADVTCRVGPP